MLISFLPYNYYKELRLEYWTVDEYGCKRETFRLVLQRTL